MTQLNKSICFLAIICLFTFGSSNSFGKENINHIEGKSKIVADRVMLTGCDRPKSKVYLDINNVRAMMLNGGDMWWNLSDAQYEVPKGSNVHSIFAGAIWIGGVDAGKQLKIAAMTYRQTGNDYFPGPLTDESVTGEVTDITKEECLAWDKHFKIDRLVIDEFKNAYTSGLVANGSYEIPEEILNWPAHGNLSINQAKYLAPYENISGQDDGTYDPYSGDFPKIFGHQSIWWVMNDKGNNHTETQGQPIGLEIHIQAFGFVTNDQINDMTFYDQLLINRSSNTLDDTYLGQWVDPDLGNYQDDYVGCDVGRGLGICYNGDDNDESGAGINGYGLTPPAIGMDFFKGPKANPNDGVDNDRDGEIDEDGELIIMSNFLYYNNTSDPVNGNPNGAQHFYNYLRNLWGNGNPCTYDGKDGLSAVSPSTPATDFMFPGNSDPTGQWTGVSGTTNPWSETTAGNPPADRRFLQSAGPFTLTPGTVMNLVVGAVWARASSGGANASLVNLKAADDVAQALFDLNFKQPEGPPAPSVDIVEMDQSIIMTLTPFNFFAEVDGKLLQMNTETYRELAVVQVDTGKVKTEFRFQGYVIYQLANPFVSITELGDPNKARTLEDFQCDIKDGITKLKNMKADDPDLGLVPYYATNFPTNDKGIFHTIHIKKDLFNSNNPLINNKKYYYKVIAYGHNLDNGFPQYLQGSVNVGDPKNAGFAYTAIPHKRSIYGETLKSKYGDTIEVVRTSGLGSSAKIVDLSPETVEEILTKGYAPNMTYRNNELPVRVKVSAPSNVVPVSLKIEIMHTIGFAGPKVASNVIYGEYGDSLVVPSTGARAIIRSTYDQILTPINSVVMTTGKLGIQLSNKIDFAPGDSAVIKKGNTVVRSVSITSSLNKFSHWFANDINSEYKLASDRDLTIDNEQVLKPYGVSVYVPQLKNPTVDEGILYSNAQYLDSSKAWLSGMTTTDTLWIKDNSPTMAYSNILGGEWGPFKLANYSYPNKAPGLTKAAADSCKFEDLYSVDIVFTTDTTKWTRCVVVNTHAGFVANNRMKKISKPSVGRNGKPVEDLNMPVGAGWFPGYAINVDKGERLNVIFGEDTTRGAVGNDMVWNPSGWGNRHYIYIMKSKYDSCKAYYTLLDTATVARRVEVFKETMWTTVPQIKAGKTLFASELLVKIRTARGFDYSSDDVNSYPRFEFSTDKYAALRNQLSVKEDALDQIRVVPNPYYAYSAYESGVLDNVIRITNLPTTKTTISIFSLNGTLIRRFERDENRKDANITYQEWDLKNQFGIPIASGAYIIHVKADDVGEKILKWFGIMRPMDFSGGPN